MFGPHCESRKRGLDGFRTTGNTPRFPLNVSLRPPSGLRPGTQPDRCTAQRGNPPAGVRSPPAGSPSPLTRRRCVARWQRRGPPGPRSSSILLRIHLADPWPPSQPAWRPAPHGDGLGFGEAFLTPPGDGSRGAHTTQLRTRLQTEGGTSPSHPGDTRVHACTHTRSYMLAHSHPLLQAYSPVHMCTHSHTLTHMRTDPRACTLTPTLVCTHAHAHMPAHSLTLAHPQSPIHLGASPLGRGHTGLCFLHPSGEM